MKNLFAGLTVLAVAGATFGARSYYVYKKLKENGDDYEDIIIEDGDEEKAYEDEVYEAAGVKETKEKTEETAEKTEEAAPETEETPVEETAEKKADIRESVKSVADEAINFAKSVKESAEKKVSEYASEEKIDEIRGTVADFCDKAAGFADTAFDKAEEAGASVADAAVKLYTDVKGIVENSKKESAEGEETPETAEESTEETAEEIKTDAESEDKE